MPRRFSTTAWAGRLYHLTEQDLRDLGVLLGHRQVLLAAIAKLSDQDARGATAHATSGGFVGEEAERRQLTVMFCDLVGSTALSAQLDVEDYRDLIRTFHETCADIVARYDGFVAKFMGDGLLAYFGYPVGHDDDAPRAARAALDIVAEATRLEFLPGCRLAVRIGIATGEVVVGNLVVQGVTEEAAVLGVTPNLAARLQGAANENEIVVSDATRRRLREGFAVDDLGVLMLKGIREPTRAWRINGLAKSVSDPGSAIPFVGREDALARLAKAWQQAQSGRLKIIQVTGQAGIGKSRLVREFVARSPDADAIAWTCSPFHRSTPLYPVSSDLTTRDEAGVETGETQRRAVFDTVAEQLTRRIAAKPAVLVVEDAHWIAAELLEKLRYRLANQALLVLVASRPGAVADRLAGALGRARLELGTPDRRRTRGLPAGGRDVGRGGRPPGRGDGPWRLSRQSTLRTGRVLRSGPGFHGRRSPRHRTRGAPIEALKSAFSSQGGARHGLAGCRPGARPSGCRGRPRGRPTFLPSTCPGSRGAS